MIKRINHLFALGLVCAFVATSCSDDPAKPQPEPVPEEETDEEVTGVRYVIAAHPNSAEPGTADYLLTVDDLTKGSISTSGNGIEQRGTYRYYMTAQNRFFSMLYGQGNPGAVTSYVLNAEGKLTEASDFVAETVQVFAPVNDEVLLIKVPRSGNENANLYRIDAKNPRLVGEESINIVKLAGNGERAHFTWATQVDNKVYAPYMSIKGCCDAVFDTEYPDSTWVAVLSYPELKLEKVIKDNRTGVIGEYFKNGLFVDEKGDAYGFSGASKTRKINAQDVLISKNPSAILKINKGTTEFDQNYFFNFEEKTGGYKINAARYFGNGKFLVQTYGAAKSLIGVKFAIVDVYEQTVEMVSGIPSNIKSATTTNYGAISADKTKAYVGLSLENGSSYVYEFDASTASAKQGLQVVGGIITGIHQLKY